MPSTFALPQNQTRFGTPDLPLNFELDTPTPEIIREWVAQLFEQNHLSMAIALAEAGLALYPDSEDVLVIAALVSEVQQDWAHSRELLEQLIKVQAGNTPAEVWYHLARVMRCEGHHSSALSVAQQALQQHPNAVDLQRLINELTETTTELTQTRSSTGR